MSTRLLQVFLSSGRSATFVPAIFEVSTTKENVIVCNCPGYRSKSNCKHIKLVTERIEANGGKYPFKFITDATPDELKAALKNEQEFRTFVIQNMKIEVI